MDKDQNDSDSERNGGTDNNQSLVGKLKRNVTEIISNTPLSKWFHKQTENTTPVVRRRQDDSDDEDLQEFQPPAKRTKLPSTKEALSLNVSEILSPISSNNSRKPLPNRNFPEPIAGPSGYQTRKILNSTSLFTDTNRSSKFADTKNNINSSEAPNKDSYSDSEESTSGYSSGRVGSKEVVSQESSKQASPSESSPHKIRSLFQTSGLFTRSSSPNANSSLSSRAPSFNPSSFASASFEDRTLSTKKILNSPFYSGRTIYGGASAYGRNTRRTAQDIQKVLRKSVSIKPTNVGAVKSNAQLGKTARRILDTLEQYSSPISDAKKIPMSSKRQKVEGNLTKYIGANPYTVREFRCASNRELHVPSVQESSRQKLDQQKSKLQESTETVRQMASSFASDSYKIPVQSEQKHVTKMKNKITSVRKKVLIEETVSEVNLPSISLPIKELPKFDFGLAPVCPKPSTSTKQQDSNACKTPEPVKPAPQPQVETKEVEVKSAEQPSLSEFKFSAPLILANCVKPLKALNNFTFSEPLIKKRRSIHSDPADSEPVKLADSAKSKKNNGENIFNVNKDSGSVDNVMDKFKVKAGTWECSVCLIRNQNEQNKCAACETPKATNRISNDTKPTYAPPISIKPPESSWECPTCMIRNKDSSQKCAACEEAKPTGPATKTVPKVMTDTGMFTGSSVNPFKSKASWTCSTCLITNKEELTKCAACETPRPTSTDQTTLKSSLTSAVKKTSDKWECSVCMVPNSAESDKCVCCETPNPNKSASNTVLKDSKAKVSSFNFGIDKATANSFTFGIPAGAQQTPGTSKASLVFGEKKVESNGSVGSFVFGIPAKTEATAPKETKESPKVETEKPLKITFGSVSAKSDTSTTPSSTTSTTSTASFVFGSKPAFSDSKISFGQKNANATESSSATAISSSQVDAPVKNDKEAQQKEDSVQPKPTFSFAPSPSKSDNLTVPTPILSNSLAKVEEAEKKTERVNPLLKPGEKLPAKATVAPSGFSFGLMKSPSTTSIVPSAGNTTTNQFTSESSATKRSKPDDEDSAPASKIPMFSFKPPAATNGDVNTNLFAPKTAGESKPAAGGFNFNFVSKTNTSASTAIVPSFGASTTQADSSKSTETQFKFAASSSTDSTNKSNGFNFSSPTPAFGVKPTSSAPEFSFGAPKPTTQPSFADSSSSKPGGFAFNTKTESKPFSFNASSTKPKDSPFSASFGSSGAIPNTQSSPFGFNQPAAPTFGNSSSQPKPAFGVAPVTSNLFGANNNQQTSGFGSSSSQATPTFGLTNPTQNSAPNGMFNFGSAAGENKAGFSFGSSSTSTGSIGSAGSFNFGSSATNAPASSSGGFNFSSGSVPSFDANAKPTFNFTGGAGLAAFSAPPVQDGTTTQRKIKKAIRRTVR